MRALILALFLGVSSGLSASIIPGMEPAAPEESSALNTTIEDVSEVANRKVEQATETARKIINNEQTQYDSYFNESALSSCSSIEQLKCPPLTPYWAENHVTRIEYINPIAGEVSCSVFPRGSSAEDDLWTSWKQDSSPKPVYTKTFVRKACIDEFGAAKNQQSDAEIALAGGGQVDIGALRAEAVEREREFREIRQSFEIDYRQSGGEQYLDLGDWLDALSTVDAEKINLQRTLEQGSVHTTEGYTVVPNQSVVADFRDAIQALMRNSDEDITSEQVEQAIRDKVYYTSRVGASSDRNFVMFLDFFTKSSKILNEIINTLFIIFVLWNLLGDYLGKGLSAKMSGLPPERQNHVLRVGTGVIAILMFYVGSHNVLTVENDEGVQKQVELYSYRVQSILRALYSYTNAAADKLAEAGISSYLAQLNGSVHLPSKVEIDSLASERLSLMKENEYLSQVETGMCSPAYDKAVLGSSLQHYRTEQLGKSGETVTVATNSHVNRFAANASTTPQGGAAGLFSSSAYERARANSLRNDQRIEWEDVNVNPYPLSEREARASLVGVKANPYDDNGKGYAKLGYFRSAEFLGEKQWLSLSGCSYNRKQLIMNNSRIREIEAELLKMKTDGGREYDLKVERMRNINKIMWKNYAELGYISMIFLPGTALMIEQNQEAITGVAPRSKESDEDDSTLKNLAEALPLLALFNGNGIANSINAMMGDTAATKPVALFASVQLIELLLNIVTTVVHAVAGVLAILWLTLTKLILFLVLPFAVIWAFADNQETKLLQIAGKSFVISFKVVTVTLSLFLAVYAVHVTDMLEYILVSDFIDNMEQIGQVQEAAATGSWITDIQNWFSESYTQLALDIERYGAYGFITVTFVIVKIILVATIIFKLPSYFFDILDVKAEDVGDKIIETVQSAAERQSMKGV